MNFPKVMLIATCLLMTSRSGLADSFLVGTDLSTSQPGPELCPIVDSCQIRVQQFTLLAPVLVDDIEVAMSGPGYEFSGSPESFTIGLGTQLGSNITGIGSGVVTSDPTQTYTTELFDFENLNLLLEPGTYYLEANGLNAMWNKASPLVTSAGTVGQGLECDDPGYPTNCSDPSRWNPDSFDYAFQIDGTTEAPEPSSWLLFGTGLLAVGCVEYHKLQRLSVG